MTIRLKDAYNAASLKRLTIKKIDNAISIEGIAMTTQLAIGFRIGDFESSTLNLSKSLILLTAAYTNKRIKDAQITSVNILFLIDFIGIIKDYSNRPSR